VAVPFITFTNPICNEREYVTKLITTFRNTNENSLFSLKVSLNEFYF
jgi:hypothetical protein